jgi:hypothetical protein
MPKTPKEQQTPKELLQALDLVRGAGGVRPESLRALSPLEATHIKRVRSVFEDPNIVAVGIAQKVTEKKDTGELSLCFYVEKKRAKAKLKAGHMIPPVMSVADRTAVFTDVQQIGKLRLEVNSRSAPLQSGFSVGRAPDTGTLGAIVQKGKKLFILSNSHVLADSGKGKRGDKIIYPGDVDRDGAKAQPVGVLSDFIAFDKTQDFVNRVDAALAEIDHDFLDKLNFSILRAKSPLATTEPVRGMKIIKRGRTSGDTEGTVKDVHFSALLPYPGLGKIGFIDQIFCTQYSKPGDSGAIIVDKASGKIAGLHFAGSDAGSIFNPIGEVMKALKFRFAAK